jgi:uncharacterized membrane protein (Fun14 family)
MKALKNIFTLLLVLVGIIALVPLVTLLIANAGVIYIVTSTLQQWYTYAYLT